MLILRNVEKNILQNPNVILKENKQKKTVIKQKLKENSANQREISIKTQS